MSASGYDGVHVRDRVEHFKSTIEQPMTYLVLGFVAMQQEVNGFIEEVVKVKYVAEYDPTIAFLREINGFNGFTQNTDGNVVKRFTVLSNNAISAEERNDLLDVLAEQDA